MQKSQRNPICPSFSYQLAVMEKVEALDLLEESWFFENLFDRRTRMLRCYSDPYTSPNFSRHVLATGLVRAPSLPPCIGREDKVQAKKSNDGNIRLDRQLSLQTSKTSYKVHRIQDKKTDGKIKLDRQLSLQTSRTSYKVHEVQEKKNDGKIKSSGESSSLSSSRHNLQRTTTLPSSMGTNELIHDNEGDLRIRQALVTSPEILPPRHGHNKAMNLQRCSKPPRNQEVEAISNTSETRFRRSNSKRMLQKSQSYLAFQELQGFKDLGFTFDNEDLSPDVVSILPGLQGNQIDELEQDYKVRKPYLSEAWLVPPPIPAYVSKNSAEEMKAQIKFWARAVATNVRQEC